MSDLQRSIDFYQRVFGLHAAAEDLGHTDSAVDASFIVDTHPGFDNVWLAGGGPDRGFKFGPVTVDYVAHGVVGRENQPELAQTFRITPQTFSDATGRNP